MTTRPGDAKRRVSDEAGRGGDAAGGVGNAARRVAAPARPGTIIQRGRAKAYRPLPPERRREILEEGLTAYGRGDFFLAHELLEPAWMGASDPAERDLYQGLIKLAAALVHGVRGNPAGVLKNLRGARDRLADGIAAGAGLGIDVPGLIEQIDVRMAGADTPTRFGAPVVDRLGRSGRGQARG